jgi:hypothetical protein
LNIKKNTYLIDHGAAISPPQTTTDLRSTTQSQNRKFKYGAPYMYIIGWRGMHLHPTTKNIRSLYEKIAT